ncbi:NADH-FMN oxidoreductase RutF, flavin reductase (DIM6/NTAB) family [Oceanobacillus limi]|uniref:NADH-FMN oxidoreductase RutF, flavin reductase (DIM6/NTAB) family n=1 Tax=Oceanobacillus limi TaxID=930131 RepID=A0A1H9Z9Q2_9BACI|nr:flavin reductase family protein [Oceanobacillus limi]SES78335.1 NADH-FMN oxidoreductase RutF, flavin reductase (DIM6/NTAB) family [Oceanobacillus limi]
MEDRVFRDAMGKFATGITVIALEDREEIKAMTVNAFMSISLEPKLIAISIAKKASMHDKFKITKKFGISILSDSQKELSMVFAKQVPKDREITFNMLDNAPVLDESLVTLSCQVSNTIDSGDHTIVVAEVSSLNVDAGDPLVFYQGKYREIK